jgi:hypothetical protein
MGMSEALAARSFARADAGTRTPDPLLTMEVLYRLSYVGVCGGLQPSAACGLQDI